MTQDEDGLKGKEEQSQCKASGEGPASGVIECMH